jgi:hypothetical protein
LLLANNLLPDEANANPDDMLIVVKADTEQSALDAMPITEGLASGLRNHP